MPSHPHRCSRSLRPHGRFARAWLLGAALAVTPCVAPPAHAAKKSDVARSLKEGDDLFQKGDYDAALTAYRSAYKLKKDPEIFIRIGRCFQQLGQKDLALDALKRYLADAPAGARRAEVEALVAELEGRTSADAPDAHAAAVAPGAGVDAGGAVGTDTAPSTTGAADAGVAAEGSAPAAAPEDASEGPGTVIWVAVGAATLVVVAGGVAATVLALQPPAPEPRGALGTFDLR